MPEIHRPHPEDPADFLPPRGALRLQTGALSRPAISLYRSAGYRRAEPFGRYRGEALARGFEKLL